MKRRLDKKIAILEKEISELTAQLIPMEKDERHPDSRQFPSQASRDGEVSSLRKSLERAHDDLALLREIRDGRLDLKDEEFFKREIKNLGQCQENVVKVLADLKAKLAAIERVKILIQNRT